MKRLLIALFIILSALSANAKDVLVCDVNGIISGYTGRYIHESIKQASSQKAALMIRLNTPGGVLDSTRDIVQMMLSADVPIIVFVAPQGARAGSAGTFITLASQYAVISEGSNIGAAHPVDISGKDIQGQMAHKIENDTIAFIKSIAQKRHRNVDAAVATVKGSESYTAREALAKGLIDAVANTDKQAAEMAGKKLHFTVDNIIELKPTALQKTAFFLSDPNILILLLFLGIASIFLEIKMPGTFIFAGTGIAAVVLFLMGINIIPINSLALILVLCGMGLLVAEVFIPSFGLLTIGAIICMGYGMYLMFSREGNMGIGISLWTIFSVIAVIAAVVILIGRLILKDFRKKPVTGLAGLTGEIGTVKSWDGHAGHIFVHGELWKAKSKDELHTDDKAKVISVKGMELTVEASKNEE